MIESLFSHYTYVLVFVLLGLGIYMVIASKNLVKKLIGVNLFQTAIFLFFISMAYIDAEDASAPIVPKDGVPLKVMVASPLPQVIVLTAIVVGIALTAVGLALIIRIYAEYGTLREDTLREVRADE
ncbi:MULTISPECIES: cation:proton antiporter subunit C [Natrinema]|uniref:NADH-ubiquinone oxidoreductase chain 4L n=1 Tax=Natrinema gari JCM 14663 TaxID=1230459 RepID=L9Z9H3_9EURY|nr:MULTISPECIES: cation:proton antiporter subunit C [Natrinema]AFO56596.1 NADH-ubiquinone oxidoreductase chain 4L [Natrinema sp. J7-2]ELY83004.1 NADH-ubiquinone oxidoreductase chain 4L [Natrinema gari JCM 14663]